MDFKRLKGGAQSELNKAQQGEQGNHISASQQAIARELSALQQSGMQKSEAVKPDDEVSDFTPEQTTPPAFKPTPDLEQEVQHLDRISQQVAKLSKGLLKSYLANEQQQLILGLSKEIMDVTSKLPNIDRISSNDRGELIAHYNRGSTISIHPQEILDTKKTADVEEVVSSLDSEPLSVEHQLAREEAEQRMEALRTGISPDEMAKRKVEERAENNQPINLNNNAVEQADKQGVLPFTVQVGDNPSTLGKRIDSEHWQAAAFYALQDLGAKYDAENNRWNIQPNQTGTVNLSDKTPEELLQAAHKFDLLQSREQQKEQQRAQLQVEQQEPIEQLSEQQHIQHQNHFEQFPDPTDHKTPNQNTSILEEAKELQVTGLVKEADQFGKRVVFAGMSLVHNSVYGGLNTRIAGAINRFDLMPKVNRANRMMTATYHLAEKAIAEHMYCVDHPIKRYKDSKEAIQSFRAAHNLLIDKEPYQEQSKKYSNLFLNVAATTVPAAMAIKDNNKWRVAVSFEKNIFTD